MDGVGTLGWARRTNGLLRRRDRAELYAQALRFLLRQSWTRLGLGHSGAPAFEAERLVPPDSRLAREAEELCEEASPPFLAAHCRRTYLWGRLLGELDGIRYDDELFYVAALLHDLGLTERYAAHVPSAACFSLHGAAVARDVVVRHGRTADVARRAAEAILFHLNVDVPLARGPEAHLLARGTACDVTGAGLDAVAPGIRAAVIEQEPRRELKRELVRVWRQHAVRPRTRSEFLSRVGRLETRILAAPFAE
jgi:HD domain